LYSPSESAQKEERVHQRAAAAAAAAREERVQTPALLSIGSAGGVEGHRYRAISGASAAAGRVKSVALRSLNWSVES